MTSLGVYAKIKNFCGVICISSGKYNCYCTEICGNEITVYVNSNYGVLDDDTWIYSNNYYLTNDRADISCKLIALRLEDLIVLDTSKGEPEAEYVEVIVSGTLLKPKHSYVREVGKNKTPFVPCTLKTLNEDNEPFCVLIVCFNANARYAEELQDWSAIEIKARIKKNRRGDLFELNVTNIKAL